MTFIFQLLFLLLSTNLVWAGGVPVQKNSNKNLVYVPNHVLVSRSQSVSGDFVCHDGTNLYFRDQDACQLASSGDCSSLFVSPIAEVEDLYLSADTEAKVTRFYTIPLTYKVSVFQASGGSQWSHVLVDEISKPVPSCSGETYEDIQITYSERVVSHEEERKFLQRVLASGFSTLNTHRGFIQNLSFIDKGSPFLNVNRIDADVDQTIASPQCQKKISEEYLQLLSGEMSGNGITNGLLIMLQNLSGPMTSGDQDSQETAVACEGVWI